jgi:subtilisin family serine protease
LDTEDVSVIEPDLEELGAKVARSYKEQVEIVIPLEKVLAMGESEAAMGQLIKLSGLKHVIGIRAPQKAPADENPQGDLQHEGVDRIRANLWHQAGFTGAGIRVGIIDPDGFKGYLSLLGSELPTAEHVFIQDGYSSQFFNESTSGGHGTACAEIVHAMAPGADLYLAYDEGDFGFSSGVDWLLSKNVQIISYSAGSLTGPLDGTGPMVDVARRATQRGVIWVNSAGNYARSHLYQAFSDSDGDGWHEFSPDQEVLAIYPGEGGGSIGLTWDDRWGGAREDYDLYLFIKAADDSYELVASQRSLQQGGTIDEPREWLGYEMDPNQTYYIGVKAENTTRSANLNLLGWFVDFETSMPEGSLNSPGDAQDVLTVGATYWKDDSLEDYSSQGPTRDGRLKPDLTGPARVSSVTYGSFSGTSASTPHVAGAAALVWNAFPGFSAGQVRQYLLDNAFSLATDGPDNRFGYGRVNLPAPPTGVQPAPNAGPVVVLNKVWQEHNVYADNVSRSRGMNIHLSLDAIHLAGQPLQVQALFYNQDSNQAVPDQNGAYAANGAAAVVLDLTPEYDPANYSDLVLFMPYGEIELPPGDYRLYFITLISLKPGAGAAAPELARSQPQTFTLNKRDETRLFAEIAGLQLQQNVEQNGEQGLAVQFSFNIGNFKGKEGQAGVYIFLDAPDNPPLQDSDNLFRSPAGQVLAVQSFSPGYEQTTYTDMLLFIPYSQLHLPPGPRYALKLYLSIQDSETQTELVRSDWLRFYYQR